MPGPTWDRWTGTISALTGRLYPTGCSTRWSNSTRSVGMANILLGVTGSVAAIRTPALYEQLKQAGHCVKVVATQSALYFFDPAILDPVDPSQPARTPAVVILDED